MDICHRIGRGNVMKHHLSSTLCGRFSALALISIYAAAPTSAQAQDTAMSAKQPATADAGAAQSSPSTPNDIVVTATRQSERSSRVPISIAAYTQQRMDAQGVRNITDIARLTPGLALTPGTQDLGGTSKTISIRGISSNVGASTTGIYVDDTPIQQRSLGNASSNVFPQVFDLDRVEVLRGPQGTLFGAGAEGGAVRFITPQPGLSKYSGYARSEVAFTDGGAPSYEFGAAVGGPIVQDKLGFRISGWYRRDGGYIDRVDPTTSAVVDKNANTNTSYVVRGALKWALTDNLSATVSVLRQQIEADDASSFYVAYSDPSKDRFANPRVIPNTSRDRFTLPSLNLQYDGSTVSVISTTSYFARNVDRVVDYTDYLSALLLGGLNRFPSGQYSDAVVDDSQRSFSQELRVQSNGTGRLHWVIGRFYSRSIQKAFQYNYDPYLNAIRTSLGLPAFNLLNGNSLFETNARSVDKQIAGFAQVDYTILDGLKLTGGLRYAKTDLSATRVSTGPVAGAGTNFTTGQAEHPLTPKAGISYQANADMLFYASVAKGYRIGGVNGPQNALCSSALAGLGLTSSPTTYKSDSVWSYEGGAKLNAAGGKVHFEASVFNIDWRNIQQNVTLAACGSGFVTNLGKARSTGFDIAVDLHPTSRITLGATLGYANVRLTETTVSSAGLSYGNKGDKIGGPPWTWTVAGEYSLPIGDRRHAYARVDYQHVGQGHTIDTTVVGVDPAVPPSQAYDQVSLRVGGRIQGLDLSIFVNNLLNQAPRLSYVRYPNAYANFQETTLRPRTIGITGSYRY